MRIVPSAAVLLLAAACGPLFPGPGELTVSNFRFPSASVQVATANPDCGGQGFGVAALAFDLPFKGTRVIPATPGTDICWRRQMPGGQWSEWNRAFTASGRSIDLQL